MRNPGDRFRYPESGPHTELGRTLRVPVAAAGPHPRSLSRCAGQGQGGARSRPAGGTPTIHPGSVSLQTPSPVLCAREESVTSFREQIIRNAGDQWGFARYSATRLPSPAAAGEGLGVRAVAAVTNTKPSPEVRISSTEGGITPFRHEEAPVPRCGFPSRPRSQEWEQREPTACPATRVGRHEGGARARRGEDTVQSRRTSPRRRSPRPTTSPHLAPQRARFAGRSRNDRGLDRVPRSAPPALDRPVGSFASARPLGTVRTSYPCVRSLSRGWEDRLFWSSGLGRHPARRSPITTPAARG